MHAHRLAADALRQMTEAPTPVLLLCLGDARVLAAELDDAGEPSHVEWAAAATFEAELAARGVEGAERDAAVAELGALKRELLAR